MHFSSSLSLCSMSILWGVRWCGKLRFPIHRNFICRARLPRRRRDANSSA
jgi:hypothetical protein